MTHKERLDMLKYIAESAAILAGHAHACDATRCWAHLFDAADIASQEAVREALHYPCIAPDCAFDHEEEK